MGESSSRRRERRTMRRKRRRRAAESTGETANITEFSPKYVAIKIFALRHSAHENC